MKIKILATAALCASLAFSFSACGDDSSNEKPFVKGLVDGGMDEAQAQCIWDTAVEAEPSIEKASDTPTAAQSAAIADAKASCAGDGTGDGGTDTGS
jgi:hypothetical protein